MPSYTRPQYDPSQFQDPQNQAYAVLGSICGPEVAAAFARYYGKNISPDQIMQVARQYGLWSVQTGMHGPQAQKMLLDKLGIPTQFSPEVNLNAINQSLQAGQTAAVSTPGHYYFLQGYNPNTGQYDTGDSGTAYANGSRYMTAQQMQAQSGAFQGQFIASQLPYNGNGQFQDSLMPYNGGGQQAQFDPNNRENVAAYIRYAAAQRKIDPEVAYQIANGEGLNTYIGDSGSSFGPFQLHYGGVAQGGNSVSGLGDTFTQQTGLDARDPNTTQAQIDFALDQAARNGWSPWHAAALMGIQPNQGIGSFQGDPSVYGNFSSDPQSRSQNPGLTAYSQMGPQGGLFGRGPVVQMGSQMYSPQMGMVNSAQAGGMQAPITNSGLFGRGRIFQ